MSPALNDELLIRQMVERWAVWRDAGDWDRFATVWHPEGVMMATWFQGPYADFIRVTREGFPVLDAIVAEFFSGQGVERARPRNLFVVGDEKQSIYSFQGADPARFLAETTGYLERIVAAGALAEPVPLLTSYRSTPEILSFVDALFSDPATREGVPPPIDQDLVRHEPFRIDGPGCVDLWPLTRETPGEERDAWQAPVDAEAEKSANRRLAGEDRETGLDLALGEQRDAGKPVDQLIAKANHKISGPLSAVLMPPSPSWCTTPSSPTDSGCSPTCRWWRGCVRDSTRSSPRRTRRPWVSAPEPPRRALRVDNETNSPVMSHLMLLRLDAEKCQGHNRCYALAPELFDVDEYGQSVLLVEGDVPAELEAKARLAVSNCPEYAISILED